VSSGSLQAHAMQEMDAFACHVNTIAKTSFTLIYCRVTQISKADLQELVQDLGVEKFKPTDYNLM
jgi:hypothetical protein